MNLPIVQDNPDGQQQVNEQSTTEELISWSLKRFAHQRLLMTTSFGMEGCALIDMYGRQEVPVKVVYLDTMFFFDETYQLRDRIVERYPHMEFVNRGTSLTPELQKDLYGPELWKHKPDLCCKLRKVDPMNEVMKEVDVWVTGLRRGQSNTRKHVRVLDWDWRYQVLKFSPLASWSRQEIWKYIQQHDVPYNVLHEKGYPSIGCTHCTTPVPGSRVGQYSRAGRWSGQQKTECGLHGDGI